MSPSLVSERFGQEGAQAPSSSKAALEQPQSQSQSQSHQQGGAKKRNRAVLSCMTCHQRRVKCDRKQPCEACVNYGCADECTFAAQPEKKARKASKDSNSGLLSDASMLRRHSGQASSSTASHSPQDERTAIPRPPVYDTIARESQKNLVGSDAQQQMLAIPSFFAFVERFQQHTQSQDKESTYSSASFYPTDAVTAIQEARLDLPTAERVKLMLDYYNDQLDYFHEISDYDDMAGWINSFLDRLTRRAFSTDMLEKGDATRLCLLLTVLVSSVQISGEGLISMFFLDSQPASFSLATLSRNVVKERYEVHIRNLLDAATQYDGPSADLVRSSLVYVHLLKNEGRHHESSNRPLITSISHIVEQEQLHLDPPPTLSEHERESRRRLFWAYYIIDRMTSAHLNFQIRIADEQITTKKIQRETWSPRLGRKNYVAHYYRTELCRIAGSLATILNGNSNSTTASAIESIEERLQLWQASLPPELHRSFPDLPPDLGPIRTLDLQRRMLQIGFNTIRAGLHRLCFFPSDSISMDRVQKSRRICVESAIEMVKVQDGLRVRMPGDHNLRCFFISYFLVESAITLILTSLIELGTVPAGEAIPEKIQGYMRYAQRARDIISSLPVDFTPAVQGVRLLSRVLVKATRILDLHAQHKLTPTESSTAIRDVLCDEDGKQMPLPFCGTGNGSGGVAASTKADLSLVPKRNVRMSMPSSSDASSHPGSGRTPNDGLTHSSSFSEASTSLDTPPGYNYGSTSSFGVPSTMLGSVSINNSSGVRNNDSSSNNISNVNGNPNLNRPVNNSAANNNNNSSHNYTYSGNAVSTPSRNVLDSGAYTSSPADNRTGEPTYEDLGLEFFNSLASALPNPFTAEGENQASTTFSQQYPQPNNMSSPFPSQQIFPAGSFGLDDQLDSWLASLQTAP